MNLTPTIIVLVLLVGLYIAGIYKNYYNALYNKKHSKKHSKNDIRPHQENIKQITKIQRITMIGIIAVIISGFFLYYKEKRIEYNNSFDFAKFIFGVVKCKKLT
jgi:predicted RND superfamily exporter protein